MFGGGTTNLYEYSKNDPVNYIDTTGRDPIALGLTSAVGAAIDFLSNYLKMREKKVPGGDKYYHCMANCQASKRGPFEELLARAMSEAREQLDERFKKRPRSDCDADRAANKTGRDSPPDQSCEVTCSMYLQPGLP